MTAAAIAFRTAGGWGAGPLSAVSRALLCRACSRPRRPTPAARALGIVAVLAVTAAELLLLDRLGKWRADTFGGIALLVALFLLVVWSAGLAGGLICRRFAALVAG